MAENLQFEIKTNADTSDAQQKIDDLNKKLQDLQARTSDMTDKASELKEVLGEFPMYKIAGHIDIFKETSSDISKLHQEAIDFGKSIGNDSGLSSKVDALKNELAELGNEFNKTHTSAVEQTNTFNTLSSAVSQVYTNFSQLDGINLDALNSAFGILKNNINGIGLALSNRGDTGENLGGLTGGLEKSIKMIVMSWANYKDTINNISNDIDEAIKNPLKNMDALDDLGHKLNILKNVADTSDSFSAIGGENFSKLASKFNDAYDEMFPAIEKIKQASYNAVKDIEDEFRNLKTDFLSKKNFDISGIDEIVNRVKALDEVRDILPKIFGKNEKFRDYFWELDKLHEKINEMQSVEEAEQQKNIELNKNSIDSVRERIQNLKEYESELAKIETEINNLDPNKLSKESIEGIRNSLESVQFDLHFNNDELLDRHFADGLGNEIESAYGKAIDGLLNKFNAVQNEVDIISGQLKTLEADTNEWADEVFDFGTPLDRFDKESINILDNSDIDKANEALDRINGLFEHNEAIQLFDANSINEINKVMDSLDESDTKLNKFSTIIDGIKEKFNSLANSNKPVLDTYHQLESSIAEELEKIQQIEKGDADISEGITRDKYNNLKALYDDYKQNVLATSGLLSEEELKDSINTLSALDKQIKKLDDASNAYDKLRQSKEAVNSVDNANNNIVDGLNNVNDAANKTDESVKKAAASFDIMSVAQKGASIASDIAKKAWEAADDALNKIIDSTKELGNVIGTSIANIPDIIDESIKKLDELHDKISSLADAGVDLQKNWFVMFNYLGAETGTEISKYLDKIQSIYGIDSDNLIGSFRAISASVQNMGLNAQDSEKALKALMNFSLDASGFTGIDFNSIATQLQSSLNMGYIGKNSPIIQALGITDQDVEQFKKLNNALERSNFLLKKGEALRGSYSKWNDTAAGKVRMLREAVSSLEGNVSRLALGLYSKLAPALTKIINLVNQFVQIITKVLGIDVNSSVANRADSIAGGFKGIESIPNDVDKLNDSNNKAADSTKKLADNTKKLQKSTDETKKSILSFDDVIQLNKDDDTGIMSDDTLDNVDDGIGELEDLSEELNEVDDILKNIGIDSNNLAGIFDEWALPENLQEIVDTFEWVVNTLNEVGELLQNGAFFEAGKRLAGMFSTLLGEIPWDEIKEKVNNFGTNFASFINGIFSNSLLFNSIGDMIAQGFNTVIGLVLSFVSELNWEDIGIALAESWRGFWDGFDSEQLGETLYEVIHGAFKTMWGFLQTMWTNDPDTGLNGWETTGIKLADVINEFVHSFTPGDVIGAAHEIMSFINGIFTTLGSFIEEMDTEDIKNKVMTFIRSIFTSFNEHAEEWGTTVGEFVDFIIDLIDGTIQTYDDTGVRNSVFTFLNKAKIGDLVGKIIQAELKAWWEGFLYKANIKINAFMDKETGNIVDWWKTGVADIKDAWMTGFDDIKDWWDGFADGLKKGFGDATDWCKEFIEKFMAGIIKIITYPLKTAVSASATAINGVIKLIGKIPGIKIDGISDKITAGKDSILNFIDKIQIPKLATGGILTQATTILAGENGREAVLPLENNTGWMDSLATKLSTQINNNNNTYNNNSGPVNINLPNKAVYTQAELLDMGRLIAEALSLYGVNVSIN